jgi:TRAP-type C4-dicarboxylate transport system substrate-binding protein
MNKQVYEGLPDDIKQIFDEFSTPETSRKYAAAHEALEVNTKASIAGLDAKMHKPDIYVLPQDEKDRWKLAVQSVKDEWMAGISNGQLLYDDLQSIIDKYYRILQH